MEALTPAQGLALCRWARASIDAALGGPQQEPELGDWAKQPGACFVTLRWPAAGADSGESGDAEGELQGCIGSLEAHRSLVADVADNAVAAALRDPRGRRLGRAELAQLDVEVSLLSPLVPLPVKSEAEAVAALRPHLDGVVLRGAGRRGTFLPQVWESFSEPGEFLYQLKRKAGLPLRGWEPSYQLFRYTVQKWQSRASKS